MEKLLRSQVVYDYMLTLMGVTDSMHKRVSDKRAERETFDKARREFRYKTARTSFRLSLLLQRKEKKALADMLKASDLLRKKAMMIVLAECGVYVDQKTFENNLKQLNDFQTQKSFEKLSLVSSQKIMKKDSLNNRQKD